MARILPQPNASSVDIGMAIRANRGNLTALRVRLNVLLLLSGSGRFVQRLLLLQDHISGDGKEIVHIVVPYLTSSQQTAFLNDATKLERLGCATLAVGDKRHPVCVNTCTDEQGNTVSAEKTRLTLRTGQDDQSMCRTAMQAIGRAIVSHAAATFSDPEAEFDDDYALERELNAIFDLNAYNQRIMVVRDGPPDPQDNNRELVHVIVPYWADNNPSSNDDGALGTATLSACGK